MTQESQLGCSVSSVGWDNVGWNDIRAERESASWEEGVLYDNAFVLTLTPCHTSNVGKIFTFGLHSYEFTNSPWVAALLF